MSADTLKFDRPVMVFGRNGLAACTGLVLCQCSDEHDGHVAVTCLTSRGVENRGLRLRVPSSALRALAGALLKLADEADKRKDKRMDQHEQASDRP